MPNDAPWVRLLGKLPLEVTTEGWALSRTARRGRQPRAHACTSPSRRPSPTTGRALEKDHPPQAAARYGRLQGAIAFICCNHRWRTSFRPRK